MKFLVSLLIFGAVSKLSFGNVIPPTFANPLEDRAQETVLRQKRNDEETWTPAPVPMSLAEQELIKRYKKEFESLKQYRIYAIKEYEEVEQEIRTPSGEKPWKTLQTKLEAYKIEIIREMTAQLG